MENLIIGLYADIGKKVGECGLLAYENIGADEIQNIMNSNTSILLEAAKSLTVFMVGLVMLSLSALYIGLLSFQGLYFHLSGRSTGHVYLPWQE